MNVPHAFQCDRVAVPKKGSTVFAHIFRYGSRGHELLWILTHLLII
jgi:hypothetical protein